MNLKKLSAACALAFASASGNALALNAFDAPDLKVILGGATAPDGFLASIANGLFDGAQGIFRFQDNNGTATTFTDDGTGWNAFFGVMKSTTDIPTSLQGKKVMFLKRSAGGSVWGVNPVARAQRNRTIQISSTGCVLDTTGVTAYRCPIVGIDEGQAGYTNPSNAGEVPDFGVSDVEPAMFKSPYNVEFGVTQLTPAETARLNVFPVNAVMMGIVATAAVPASTYMSRQDYGSMLSGFVRDWGQIDPSITTGNLQVVICRRVQGSGTQASYNWMFSNFPCQSAFNGVVPPARMVADSAGVDLAHAGTSGDPILIDPTAGFTVVENSGSGNVRDCLVRADNRTDYNFTGDDGKSYRIRFSLSANPFRAIGVLSLDSYFATSNTMDPTGATKWSFRMLDGAGIYNPTTQAVTAGPGTGIAPSKANLMTGKYDFAVELAMQYRNVSVTNVHGDVVPALSGLKKDFADLFITRAGDPAFNTLNHVTALPPTYIPTLDVNGVPTNNTARGTRGANTCSPWQKLL
jgi:hypothetical protein